MKVNVATTSQVPRATASTGPCKLTALLATGSVGTGAVLESKGFNIDPYMA